MFRQRIICGGCLTGRKRNEKASNTLYVTTEDAYLSLNGETVEVIFGDDTHKQIPLHTLNAIVSFSYKGASPALMGKCAEAGVLLSFFTPSEDICVIRETAQTEMFISEEHSSDGPMMRQSGFPL